MKLSKFLGLVRCMLAGLHNALFTLVLSFFENINRKIRSKLPSWRLREETFEHVHMALNVFKLIILPLSFIYLFGGLLFLKENALDSMLWGILIFFYSNFLPDLTCIARRGSRKMEDVDLPWYKKYAVLLFAPVLVILLFSNVHLGWKTVDNFHNLKSMTVYGGFLFLYGFVIFGGFPVSLGQVIEILVLPIYGLIGYLTHLKVDKVL